MIVFVIVLGCLVVGAFVWAWRVDRRSASRTRDVRVEPYSQSSNTAAYLHTNLNQPPGGPVSGP